jgi:hypothetical protein
MTTLHDLLLQKQEELKAELRAGELIDHPGAKGDVAELDWVKALNDFLPARYQVAKAFVIDSKGNRSEEIDLVIYDRHFCPLLFEAGGRSFIAAESVYAIFEVKQSLNREHVIYAMKKAASVRALHRTSGLITDFSGKQGQKTLFPILAGIVATRCDWTSGLGGPLKAALAEDPQEGRLDIGCALDTAGFEVISYDGEAPELAVSQNDASLVFFYLRLLARLQLLGTVAAIDFDAYSENVREH